MSKVFVKDLNKCPLAPTHPARARQLLKKGKAAVYREYPFTIILKREVSTVVACGRLGGTWATTQETAKPSTVDNQPLRLKIDPGSKTTGLAILNDNTGEVVWAAELQHRGQQIKKSLEKRCAIRRSRRYRKPRFNNRMRPSRRGYNVPFREGWLPPSLMSRVYNIQTWVSRLRRYCPIKTISPP
jgi:hypothetical protein